MKTPSISLVGAILLSCGLVAASVQPLFAQKKGPPVPQVNGNKNGNQNPPPVPVVKKVVPRRVTKTEVKVEAIPKEMIPPIQKRVEQPKLPPGMKRMGPGGDPDKMKDLAKLKLLPPLKRGGTGNAALVEEAEVGNTSTFPPIGDGPLDQLGDRIRDLAFAKEAGEMGDLAGMLGFADLINGLDSLVPDLGLGDRGDDSEFADLEEFGSGGSRKDGLPADAPPSGWGARGGFASFDGTTPPSAEVNTGSDGTVTKTWTTTGEDGAETSHTSSRSPDGSSSSGHTTRDEGGSYRVVREKSANGTLSETRTSLYPDGTGGEEYFRRDPDGTFWFHNGRVRPSNDGVPNVDWGPTFQVEGDQMPSWMRNLGGNPGDEGTTEGQRALANWMWRQHNIGKTTPGGGPKMTTYVNPGSPDYEGSGLGGYPSIGAAFAGNFAVNPDPTSMSSGGGTPSARAWQLMKQTLKNGMTPGPMPGVEDPRFGR